MQAQGEQMAALVAAIARIAEGMQAAKPPTVVIADGKGPDAGSRVVVKRVERDEHGLVSRIVEEGA